MQTLMLHVGVRLQRYVLLREKVSHEGMFGGEKKANCCQPRFGTQLHVGTFMIKTRFCDLRLIHPIQTSLSHLTTINDPIRSTPLPRPITRTRSAHARSWTTHPSNSSTRPTPSRSIHTPVGLREQALSSKPSQKQAHTQQHPHLRRHRSSSQQPCATQHSADRVVWPRTPAVADTSSPPCEGCPRRRGALGGTRQDQRVQDQSRRPPAPSRPPLHSRHRSRRSLQSVNTGHSRQDGGRLRSSLCLPALLMSTASQT